MDVKIVRVVRSAWFVVPLLDPQTRPKTIFVDSFGADDRPEERVSGFRLLSEEERARHSFRYIRPAVVEFHRVRAGRARGQETARRREQRR